MEVKEFKEVREVKAICFIAKYTKVSDLGRDGLKAQQAHSPGQAKRHPGSKHIR